MRQAGDKIDGLSLHYYTMPDYYPMDPFPQEKKTSATEFDSANYYRTLKRAGFMDELIHRHRQVMDRFDPEEKVAIVVDEWGTWHKAQEGTNPAFLFQQNTMRDAIVAGMTLNIFNRHSQRVRMANLAQMINVLQSLILTEGRDMILTPTYHVFDLFQEHMGARLVDCHVEPALVGTAEAKVPAISASASVSAAGKCLVTLVNAAHDASQNVQLALPEGRFSKVSARSIQGQMTDHNAFDQPEKIRIKTQDIASLSRQTLKLELPACSVVAVSIE